MQESQATVEIEAVTIQIYVADPMKHFLNALAAYLTSYTPLYESTRQAHIRMVRAVLTYGKEGLREDVLDGADICNRFKECQYRSKGILHVPGGYNIKILLIESRNSYESSCRLYVLYNGQARAHNYRSPEGRHSRCNQSYQSTLSKGVRTELIKKIG